jgi:hypothetical protein
MRYSSNLRTSFCTAIVRDYWSTELLNIIHYFHFRVSFFDFMGLRSASSNLWQYLHVIRKYIVTRHAKEYLRGNKMCNELMRVFVFSTHLVLE